MGPFLIAIRQLKFLMVGIDYFTKWVEVEALATIMEKNVRSLSVLKETLNGNVLSPMINPNQQSLYMERILQNTCIYENLPYKEMPSSPRNKGWFHATIKNPKPSEIKVRIVCPNSSTLKLWKFSNLTFRGYLPSTTPVLFVRSSSSSLLCKFCLEHARIM